MRHMPRAAAILCPAIVAVTALLTLILHRGQWWAERRNACGTARPTSMGAYAASPQEVRTALPPTAQTTLWSADFETGDLTGFQTSQYDSDPTPPRVTISVARSGTYAGAFTIPPGGRRSEAVPHPAVTLSEDDDRWFTFSTRLGEFVPMCTQWQVITQWKNNGAGSPPLSLAIADGQYELTGGWGWPGTDTPKHPKLDSVVVGPAVTHVWDDWIAHIRFSSDPAVGSVSLWRNGLQAVQDWHPRGGTLYPQRDSYWKIGYYRSPQIADNATVYVDDLRIGRAAR